MAVPEAGEESGVSAVADAQILGSKPQYVLVAQTLMEDIRRGRYGAGDLLPPETTLCTQFGVSRHTLREAMRLLIERGMVIRQRGVGTHVTGSEGHPHYVQSTASISDLPRYAEDTRLVTQSVQDVIAEGCLCELLACPPGQRWLHVRGFRYLDNGKEPMARSRIYISATYAGIKDLIGVQKVPLYTLIERQYGERVGEVKQRIDAKVIDDEEAADLKVQPGTAGLVVTRHYYGINGRLLEVAINLHPAERFSYSMSLRLNGAAKA